tara:strand:+ start:6104 stop:6562 length:459 start_codon:yes stop_codon:yes gene_type:complete
MSKSKHSLKKILVDNWVFLAVILLIGIIGSLYFQKEGFDSISKEIGNRPSTFSDNPNDDLLLADWYPVHKPNPQFSNQTEATQYLNKPIFSANSVYNNNIEKWREPSNGSCMPPGICGNFYSDKKVEYKNEPCKPPMYSKTNPRVNFYLSES